MASHRIAFHPPPPPPPPLPLPGTITSGGPSPCLKKNIAMGYVKSGFHKSGTAVQVKVRNRLQPAVVTKMPFVESRYGEGTSEEIGGGGEGECSADELL